MMIIDSFNITFKLKNYGIHSSEPETVKNVAEKDIEEPVQTTDYNDKVSITEKARDYMLSKYNIADSEALQNGSDKARKLGLIKNLIKDSTGEKIKLKDVFDQVKNMGPDIENPAEDVIEAETGADSVD